MCKFKDMTISKSLTDFGVLVFGIAMQSQYSKRQAYDMEANINWPMNNSQAFFC